LGRKAVDAEAGMASPRPDSQARAFGGKARVKQQLDLLPLRRHLRLWWWHRTDIEAEIASHLAEVARELAEQGVAEEDARRQAIARLGDLTALGDQLQAIHYRWTGGATVRRKLMVLVFVCLAASLLLLGSGLWVAKAAKPPIPKEYLQGPPRINPDWAEQMKADPKLGTIVHFPSVQTLEGKTIRWPYAGKVVVMLYRQVHDPVWLVKDAKLVEGQTGKRSDVAVVTVTGPRVSLDQVKRDLAGQKLWSGVLLDTTGALGKQINPVDSSRLYVIGRNGALLMEENPFDDVRAVAKKGEAALAEALKGGKVGGQAPGGRAKTPAGRPASGSSHTSPQ
jgi:hypothetical protein